MGRLNITDSDRIFWLTVMRMLKDWRDALVIVQPATVIKWHRNGFRHYWRRKSRSKPGRPPIPMAITMLIRRRSSENVTWGAPRIRDELTLLGHVIAVSTFAKYMVRSRKRETDHIIPMGETHLLRIVREYVEYYNNDRPHQSLEGNAPEPRVVEDVGQVVAKPVLGGLHHRYSRVA